MGKKRWTIPATAALLLLSACSCRGDDDNDNTTPTTQSPEPQVEAAYLAFANMGARLLQAPNPQDPEIPQRTSGEAQANLIEGLTTLQSTNQRYVLGPNYSQEVLSVDVTGSKAEAEVCVVDDSQRVDSTTGEVLAEGPTTVRWMATLVRVGDGWTVDQIVEQQVAQGVGECAT